MREDLDPLVLTRLCALQDWHAEIDPEREWLPVNPQLRGWAEELGTSQLAVIVAAVRLAQRGLVSISHVAGRTYVLPTPAGVASAREESHV